MKKLLALLVIKIVLIGIVMLTSVVFINYDKIYQEFANSTKIDISTIKKQDIKLRKFPLPHLVIDEIIEEGKIKLSKVKVNFSLMSLLTFNPKITNVTVEDAVIYLPNDDGILQHHQLISELIANDTLFIKAKIQRLSLRKSDNDIPKIINNFSFDHHQDKTIFDGTIDDFGKLEGHFIKSGQSVQFVLDVKNPHDHFHIEESYQNGLFNSGKVDIKTTKLSHKLIKFIPDFASLPNYLYNDEQVDINFDIALDDQGLVLQNIIVNSASLEGTGEIQCGKVSSDLTNIKFNFNKIDLSQWLHSAREDAGDIIDNQFDFDNKKIFVNISVAQMKLINENTLQDINFQTHIENGKMDIQDLSGKIDVTGKFQISGIISRNSFRSIFHGSIFLQHSNLNDFAVLIGDKAVSSAPVAFHLKSDVQLSAVDLFLQNLLLQTVDSTIIGNVSVKFIGTHPRTAANLQFSYVDFDQPKLPLLDWALNYARSLITDMKDEAYLSKFIPIRKIHSRNSFNFTFDTLKFNNRVYKDTRFYLEFTPSKVAIEQFYILDDQNWLDTNIILETGHVTPKVTLVIHNGSITANFLSAPGMLSLRQKILDTYDLNKVDIIANGHLRNLYHPNIVFERVDFALKSNGELFKISKFASELFGGKITASGNLLINPYSINCAYALNSAYLKEITKLLPEGMFNSDGMISASGTWATHGDKLDEQLYNLSVQSNLIAKNISFTGIALDDFIDAVRKKNYNIGNIKKDLHHMVTSGSTNISTLKSDVEVSHGLTKMQSVLFNTKYASVSGAVNFNI